MERSQDTHSVLLGYLLWIFGFIGAHRFYYGRPVSGTIWFFTLGLLFVGWIIDLFLIPGMNDDASYRFEDGPLDYNIGWILLTFLGIFGIHRFYMGKWLTGIIWLLTGGLFLIGYLYDYWTLKEAHIKAAGGSLGLQLESTGFVLRYPQATASDRSTGSIAPLVSDPATAAWYGLLQPCANYRLALCCHSPRDFSAGIRLCDLPGSGYSVEQPFELRAVS